MNFLEALDTKLEDIKRPPMLPVGHYRAQVKKIPEILDEHELYQYVDFSFQLIGAEEDVDPTELQEYGNVSGEIRSRRFIFNKTEERAFERAKYQLRRFLTDHLKIDGAESMPLRQALDAAPGHSCLIQIGRRADKQDKEVIYEDVKGTAPII
jgi:hypothetical protein